MPHLSIIIPVFNEVSTIEEVVTAVRARGPKNIELIVVDDCSTDGTQTLLSSALAGKVDRIVFHPRNAGKGAALRTGIQSATGDFIVFQDADLEYDPGELSVLLDAVAQEGVDAAYGSRFLLPEVKEVCPWWHRWVNRGLTEFSNLFTGYRLTDMETCYKLFPAEFLKGISMDEDRFGIEPELTAKASAAGLRIAELPIVYNRRDFDEGKKIGASDGLRALYVIGKYGFRYL